MEQKKGQNYKKNRNRLWNCKMTRINCQDQIPEPARILEHGHYQFPHLIL